MSSARSEPFGKDERILVKLSLENLQLFGHHGVGEEERQRGQLFSIDAEIEFDLPCRDELSETIDYTSVIERIRQVNDTSSFRLIETFAQAIAEEICRSFRKVRRVSVRVRKPKPPVAADITLDAVAAEVIRTAPHNPLPSREEERRDEKS